MKIVSKIQNNSFIIVEGGRRDILPEMKDIKDFSKILSKKAKEQFGTNFKFLLTWGAAIGGIMLPLDDFLKTGQFFLEENERILILIGVGSIIFFENEEKIKKVVKTIEEKGLINSFVSALSKAETLRDTFISFIQSLNVTTQTLTNILSYAFLIPVLPMLLEFGRLGFNEAQLRELIMRFTYFTSISISGIALKELVEKIVKRFRG